MSTSTLTASQIAAPKNARGGWFKVTFTDNWVGSWRVPKSNPLKAVWNRKEYGGVDEKSFDVNQTHYLFSMRYDARGGIGQGLTADVIAYAAKVFGQVGAADVQNRSEGAYMLVAKADFERVVEALHAHGLLTDGVQRHDGIVSYGSRQWKAAA